MKNLTILIEVIRLNNALLHYVSTKTWESK
jgi:hypothetical protein